MKTVDIALGARAYQIRIGRGLLSAADEIAPWVGGAQACIVSDEVVAPLYLESLRRVLTGAGKKVITHIMPAGEAGKTVAAAEGIFDLLLTEKCDRDTTVIALGGGVVGDIAGFAAACYQRGVAFIQIPTTLLAQVDSSVGGKTGVNHPLGKNMIGAFHQPRRVIADTAVLDTLHPRQLKAGLAEVIKYGVIRDAEFFVWLEDNIRAAVTGDHATLEHIIERSCINKAKIVERDEFEDGARALLNLGHTFGHAIETGAGYGNWLHGEAVATGMVMAARLSAELGMLTDTDRQRIIRLIAAAGLPVGAFAGLPAAKMLELMKSDKKVRAGTVRLVLPTAIGTAEIVSDYPADALAKVVAQFAESEEVLPTTVEFDGSDDRYQAWLAANPHGFVINTRRRVTKRCNYMVLHRARCLTISEYTPVGRPPGGFTEGTFIKVCAPTVDELRIWARQYANPGQSFTKQCGMCKPV